MYVREESWALFGKVCRTTKNLIIFIIYIFAIKVNLIEFILRLLDRGRRNYLLLMMERCLLFHFFLKLSICLSHFNHFLVIFLNYFFNVFFDRTGLNSIFLFLFLVFFRNRTWHYRCFSCSDRSSTWCSSRWRHSSP